MLVLHGVWDGDEGWLELWLEDSALPARAAARGKWREHHPYAVIDPTERLAPLGVGHHPYRRNALALTLPSGPDFPQPSPLLQRPELATAEVDRLADWYVQSVVLRADEALELLLRLEDIKQLDSSHFLIGNELGFLAECAKLALEYAAQGRVLPNVVQGDRSAPGERLDARWEPTVEGDSRLEELIRACPAILRAITPTGEKQGQEPPSAAACVRSIVGVFTDGLFRDAATGELTQLPGGLPGELCRALSHEYPEMQTRYYSAKAVGEFVADIQHWRTGSADVRDGRRYRTCFRLEPLEAGAMLELEGDLMIQRSEGWLCEILVQDASDPTLLIPAEALWAGPAQSALDDADHGRAEEELLAGLARASRIWPHVRSVLSQAAPASFVLDAEEGHELLNRTVGQLEQAGFPVLLPSWWREAGARLSLKLNARARSERSDKAETFLGLNTLCAYEWQVAIGDTVLTEQQLRALAEMKIPLVRSRGGWIELRRDELAQALALLQARREKGEQEATLQELMRMQAGLAPDTLMTSNAALAPALDDIELVLEGELADLLPAREATFKLKRAPRGLPHRLWAFQRRGFSWLDFLGELGFGACLADDMGLGKTMQLLSVLLHEREKARARTCGPTLLVCPMSAVGNWEKHAATWAGSLKVYAHHSSERLRGKKLRRAVENADLVITTYGLMGRDLETLRSINWHRVAVDEAQNVKNAGTAQRKALASISSKRRIALTGTPVENRLSELWSIMDWLNPGLLGSYQAFRKAFAIPIERYHDEEALARLQRLIAPFILRRTIDEPEIKKVLPPKIEESLYCSLTEEQASLYQAVVDELMRELEELDREKGKPGIQRARRRTSVLAAIAKLKQICNHPALLVHDDSPLEGRSGKLDALVQRLETARELGEKALVFTQYPGLFGERLRDHLSEQLGCEVLFMDGRVAKKKDVDALVARFQSPEGPPVFLLGLKKGGTALDLYEANHVVHFDRWWNPAVEDQATARAHRQGQKKVVQVTKMICLGTIEEHIDAMITSKRALAKSVIRESDEETWLGDLSTEELGRIIALSPRAVSVA